MLRSPNLIESYVGASVFHIWASAEATFRSNSQVYFTIGVNFQELFQVFQLMVEQELNNLINFSNSLLEHSVPIPYHM